MPHPLPIVHLAVHWLIVAVHGGWPVASSYELSVSFVLSERKKY